MHLSHKRNYLIVRGDDIAIFFSACFTALEDDISFFILIHPDWKHDPMTGRCTITRKMCINMERSEAFRAVISCRSCRMFRGIFPAICTEKRFISHDKSHNPRLARREYRFLYPCQTSESHDRYCFQGKIYATRDFHREMLSAQGYLEYPYYSGMSVFLLIANFLQRSHYARKRGNLKERDENARASYDNTSDPSSLDYDWA